MNLSTFLKKQLVLKQSTQKEFAELIGKSPQTVCNWLADRYKPEVYDFLPIAIFLAPNERMIASILLDLHTCLHYSKQNKTQQTA